MRFLIKANIPVEEGNQAIINGTLPKTMEKAIADLKPEAVYFGLENSQRTAYFFVNMNENSDMVKLVEPFFFAFNADVECIPVMTPEDLHKGGAYFEGIIKKYKS
jgi:hypothetical protein